MGSAGVAQLVEHFIGNEEVHEFDSHHQLQQKNLFILNRFFCFFEIKVNLMEIHETRAALQIL